MNDDSLNVFEKLEQSIPSLITGVPSVISGVKNMGSAYKALSSISSEGITLKAAELLLGKEQAKQLEKNTSLSAIYSK